MVAHTKLTQTEIHKVIVLHILGRTQNEISDRLGLSQPTIHKALKMARAERWIVDQPICNLSSERIREVEQLIHCPGLEDRLKQEQPKRGRHLKQLRILDVGEELPTNLGEYRKYQNKFGRLAARHLTTEIFPDILSMGVSWGGTLQATIDGIELEAGGTRKTGSRIQFFPVCGAPPDAIVSAKRAASILVADLDEQVNGVYENPNNFTGVSAAIPASYSPVERKALMRYFHELPGFRNVFGVGKKPGLVRRMDAVMTSVGTTDPKEDPWILAAAKAADISPNILIKYTYGNINGLFLPRKGIPRDIATKIERVNRAWTGIELDDYLRCAQRAKKPDAPGGTVLIAFGRKGEITLECIRLGLVSHLVIDAYLAAKLAEQLDYRPLQN